MRGLVNTLYYMVEPSSPPIFSPQYEHYSFLDGPFLKRAHLVYSVIDTEKIWYHWKTWEDRVGHKLGASPSQVRRSDRGKEIAASSSNQNEEDNVDGWKKVLGKIDKVVESQIAMEIKIDKIHKEQPRLSRKMASFFRRQNIKFTPSPPDSLQQ